MTVYCGLEIGDLLGGQNLHLFGSYLGCALQDANVARDDLVAHRLAERLRHDLVRTADRASGEPAAGGSAMPIPAPRSQQHCVPSLNIAGGEPLH
jgi:hypothetical protein